MQSEQLSSYDGREKKTIRQLAALKDIYVTYRVILRFRAELLAITGEKITSKTEGETVQPDITLKMAESGMSTIPAIKYCGWKAEVKLGVIPHATTVAMYRHGKVRARPVWALSD